MSAHEPSSTAAGARSEQPGAGAVPAGAPQGHTGADSGAAGPPPDASLSNLLSQLTGDVSTLFRKEVELAKAEVKQEVSRAGKAAGMFGGAAGAGYFALLLISFAIAWGLAELMPTALAFLIVGVVYAIVAAVLYTQGKKRLAEFNPVPEQTVETVKEDLEWVKNRRQ